MEGASSPPLDGRNGGWDWEQTNSDWTDCGWWAMKWYLQIAPTSNFVPHSRGGDKKWASHSIHLRQMKLRILTYPTPMPRWKFEFQGCQSAAHPRWVLIYMHSWHITVCHTHFNRTAAPAAQCRSFPIRIFISGIISNHSTNLFTTGGGESYGSPCCWRKELKGKITFNIARTDSGVGRCCGVHFKGALRDAWMGCIHWQCFYLSLCPSLAHGHHNLPSIYYSPHSLEISISLVLLLLLIDFFLWLVVYWDIPGIDFSLSNITSSGV